MKLPRRKFLHLAAGAAALLALPRVASALDYPTRPVHLLVGFAAGGPLDTSARLIGQWLSERLGQPFVIENRPGAGSNLATEIVARAPPDGYTLLEASAANAWNAALYDNLSFNFIRDIALVAGVRRAAGVMEVNPSVPVRTVPEFIAYAKANPGKINMATGGAGSAPHLYGELFKMMAGVDLVTVNYRGSAPALPDLIAGQVQVMFDVVISSIGHIRAGKLRPLGVTTTARLDVLPDVPPISDCLPGYDASSWDGIGAPANTAPEIVGILNKQVNAALADPTFKARLADLGAEPFAGSTAEFGKFIVDYPEQRGKVIRAAGIKAERIPARARLQVLHYAYVRGFLTRPNTRFHTAAILTLRSSLVSTRPAGAVACRAPGRLQSRRHRIPLPWPDRRAWHRPRKVSCCKKQPAGELRTRWRGEGQCQAPSLIRRGPSAQTPSRRGRSEISPMPRLL